jgi:two-component system chemotaxis response regulator CheB
MRKKIKVLVVDDSALIRQMLEQMLASDPAIEVVGTAQDPYIAREKIKKLNPDVITLDVEMPRMDGLTFLSNLMRLRPMPVVMVSSLTEKGADITLRALEMGAIDFVTKPKIDLANSFDTYAEQIIEKVKVAANANISQIEKRAKLNLDQILDRKIDPKLSADAVIRKTAGTKQFRTTGKIVAIGASTGGTEAIREILAMLPADAPGIVISQHIPEGFSAAFANRMNENAQMVVYEARDGQQILPGHVYIAPGDRHLLVVRNGAQYNCRLSDGPLVNRHRPSVDVMFRSVAENVGPNAIGVILTGMGKDGAVGLQEIHENGGSTIAQDERSSVVWGMPGEAVKMGAADLTLPLSKIPEQILEFEKSSGKNDTAASGK